MILAADVGGTKVLMGLFSDEGELLYTERVWLPHPPLPATVALRVLLSWQEMLGQAGLEWDAVRGGCLALPGPIDDEMGVVLENANLGWHQVPFIAIMQQAGWPSERPLFIQDDGLLATWGEYRRGGHGSAQSLAVLSVGTGVGLGVVQQGQLLQGAELGHVPIGMAHWPCRCGLVGCLETIAGGWGIERQYAAETGRTRVEAEAILQAAKNGDVLAMQVLTDAGSALAQALVIVVHLFRPDRIVIGGGLGLAAWTTWQPMFETVLSKQVLESHRRTIQWLGQSALEGRSALEGAYAYAVDAHPVHSGSL